MIDNERRRPYDSFELRTQINFTDRVDPVGSMTIRGDLASKPLGDPGNRHGAALRLRAPLSRRLGLGVDGEVYQRTSHYGNALLVERDDRIPQVRAYLSCTAGAF